MCTTLHSPRFSRSPLARALVSISIVPVNVETGWRSQKHCSHIVVRIEMRGNSKQANKKKTTNFGEFIGFNGCSFYRAPAHGEGNGANKTKNKKVSRKSFLFFFEY